MYSATRVEKRAVAIRSLRLDAVLVEVAIAFGGAGVRSLLLRGPAIARWLYDDPNERDYGDIDLLVEPAAFGAGEAVLASLGFAPTTLEPPHGPSHHTAWTRPGKPPVTVELHRWLSGLDADADRVWSVLSRDPTELVIAGARVPTLSIPGRLLVVGLHAAQHGVGFDHALTDLAASLEHATFVDWQRAASVAAELGGAEAFAAGLRLDPRGAALVRRLGLPPLRSQRLALRLATPPPTAHGFARLATTKGARNRFRLLAHELVAPPHFMRTWQPVARRGWRGLALAYVWRPFWLLWKAPGGLRAWRRAGSAVGGGADDDA